MSLLFARETLRLMRGRRIAPANIIAGCRKTLSLSGVIVSLLFITVAAMSLTVSAQTINFENPPYTTGTIHNQDGWSSLGGAGLGCANYDHKVTTNNASAPVSFGAQSLRISNAVTSGCFSDQTFSKSNPNEAGETTAQNGGLSGGTRQTIFVSQFSIASAVPSAQQSGLYMSVSPDRGDGARMGYLRFEDQADGIHVFFDDYIDAAPFGGAVGDAAGCGNEDDFTDIDIATLSRAIPHTIKFVMKFNEGPRNDIVEIYIDGVLKKTGTSWEDYFRYCEGNPTRTVDSLLFRTGGASTPAPATLGNGFLIDSMSAATNSILLVDDNGAQCPTASYTSIQTAINAANPGDTIQVCAGTYNEDVNANKAGLILDGAGAATTTILGPSGGSTSTITVGASNVEIKGFTITRQGNAPATWNDPLNTAGISVQGTSITGMLVHDNILTGNRTGIDVNNSNGHTIRNNQINFNRTGLIFRNQTDNITFVENFVRDNWTVGILFLDASGGTNSPVQTALNSIFSNNNISGNWYGQIVDRQSGGSLPAPGTTNTKNFRGNWFGTTAPVTTTANSAEPGYAAQIPVAYGGTATNPGGQPDIAGPASANFSTTPILTSGTDTNVETTPGRGTFGFQSAAVTITPANAQNWSFFDESPSGGSGSGAYSVLPAGAPLGIGSARLTVDSTGRENLFNNGAMFLGTRFDQITRLGYSSYQNTSPSNPDVAISLQFAVDYNLNDANTTFQGRLVYEPYQGAPSGTVQQNVWQTWDALAGKFWATRTNATGSNGLCPQSNPCTRAQLLAAFPNLGIHTDPVHGGLIFRLGGPIAGGFTGSVDKFVYGVNGVDTTFDFDPAQPTVTINQASGQADPTSVSPINFTVTFSEPVNGFTSSDVVLSGTANPTTAVISGGGPTYNVAVSGMNASGTVIATIPANVATSTASGAPNQASTSTDNTVTYNYIVISGQIVDASNQPIPNVSVALSGAQSMTTMTNASGNYSFSGLFGGSYLITPTLSGYTFEPINRSYTGVNVSITNANFVGRTGASPRIVRVVNAYTTPGQNVTVPIELVSQGNENSVGFSLTYDQSLVFNPMVALGSAAAGGSLVVNNSTAGQVGVLVALPSGQSFTTGTRQIATVTFSTAANTASNTPVNFSGTPVIRRVANPNADPLPASFTDGFIVFSQGYEADVANRFTGDGVLAVDDFTQIGRFVAGLDTINPNYNEFERADNAPRGTKGDGSLDVTDFTQAGRYVAGLDAYQTAGGPTTASLFSFLPSSLRSSGTQQVEKGAQRDNIALPRIVRVVNTQTSPGQQVTVSIEIDAEGDEAGVGFTVSYDPTKLSNPLVQLGTGMQGATLIPNTMTVGKVGVAATYIGNTIQAGTRQVFTIRFDVAANAAPGQTPLMFTGAPPVVNRVSSVTAQPLTTTFADGFVTILAPTAASVVVAGQVLSATGQPVPNAKVFLTNELGVKRQALTNAFGYYGFEDVTVGETYIISAVAKRYTFTPRVITLNEELTSLNLVAEP